MQLIRLKLIIINFKIEPKVRFRFPERMTWHPFRVIYLSMVIARKMYLIDCLSIARHFKIIKNARLNWVKKASLKVFSFLRLINPIIWKRTLVITGEKVTHTLIYLDVVFIIPNKHLVHIEEHCPTLHPYLYKIRQL